MSKNGSTFPVVFFYYFNLDFRLNLYTGNLCVNYNINRAAEKEWAYEHMVKSIITGKAPAENPGPLT